jgi:hypothetical protein
MHRARGPVLLAARGSSPLDGLFLRLIVLQQNLRSARAVGNASAYLSDPVFSLLFDPQVNFPAKL